MKVLVAVKRVIDYNVKIRVNTEGTAAMNSYNMNETTRHILSPMSEVNEIKVFLE